MKFLVTIAVLIGFSATNAQAVSNGMIYGKGAICQNGSTSLICYLNTGHGYGIGISKDFVFVQNSATKRIVFKRWQPKN